MFAAAGKLKIDKLMSFAAEELVFQIDQENAFEILKLSNKYENEKLRQTSFKVIQNMFCYKKINENLATQPEKLQKFLDFKEKLDEDLMEFL